ncbi:hypothetical protein FEM03_23480 [Phragmitibacter flavus]|uniref:Uncharacterized protein n=1 Tax=Phragmitibacter flavus TaxID=2576071 RepID=A0A5R8K7F1_9BACT|nr:hypothetical protein [Phragmitibacter flavus]TLD68284.1 hypothetical protein FEM03_23480 [Phragmitibacter flavus]
MDPFEADDMEGMLKHDSERLRRRMLYDQRRSRQRLLVYASTFALGTLAAAFGTILLLSRTAQNRESQRRNQVEELNVRLDNLKQSETELHNRINKIVSQIENAPKPSPESELSERQQAFEMNLLDLNTRLTSLENALLESPEKSLTLPLMRKDLEGVNTQIGEIKSASQRDLERLYSQQAWILSGIATFLVALAAGSISVLLKTLFRSKDKSEAGDWVES